MTSLTPQPNRLASILQTLGEAYLARGQYAEAVEKLGQLVKAGSRTPEVHRNLAMAHLGNKDCNEVARNAYLRALKLYPQDEELWLKTCRVMLDHKATDDISIRCYQRALAFQPPFELEIYRALFHYFHLRGELQHAFEALKQIVIKENGGNLTNLTTMVKLGWQIGKDIEISAILAGLEMRNGEAKAIRRLRALDYAYAVNRGLPFGPQGQGVESNSAGSSANQILSEALAWPDPLRSTSAVRDYCTLRLAQIMLEPEGSFTRPHEVHHHHTGHNYSSKRSFGVAVSGDPAVELLLRTCPDSNDEHAAGPDLPKAVQHVLALKIRNLEQISNRLGKKLADALAKRLIEFSSKYLAKGADAKCFSLDDGLMAVADSIKLLAISAVDLLHKIERYNTTVAEPNQIFVQVVLHSRLDRNGLDSSSGLRILYETLHLLESRLKESQVARTIAAESNRLFIHRMVYERIMGNQITAARLAGPVLSEAPGFQAEVYEAVWRNPLEYVSEKTPYNLGRFIIVEKLKGSRIAGTYRGRDRQLERPLILKALSPNSSLMQMQNPELREQLIHAVRRLGQLELPGVAVVYDMGYQDEVFFYVREYLEGTSLERLLKNRRLTPLEALSIGLKLCRVLQPAHLKRAFHCNLKPSNIWLYANGEMKVADFFVPGYIPAFDPDDIVDPTQWQYSAVEWLRHMVPAATCDIYSIGIILYELLCGEHPFAHAPELTHPSQLDRLKLPELASYGLDLPQLCSDTLARTCHKDPLERYQSLYQLEDALHSCIEALTQHAVASEEEIREESRGGHLLEAEVG